MIFSPPLITKQVVLLASYSVLFEKTTGEVSEPRRSFRSSPSLLSLQADETFSFPRRYRRSQACHYRRTYQSSLLPVQHRPERVLTLRFRRSCRTRSSHHDVSIAFRRRCEGGSLPLVCSQSSLVGLGPRRRAEERGFGSLRGRRRRDWVPARRREALGCWEKREELRVEGEGVVGEKNESDGLKKS